MSGSVYNNAARCAIARDTPLRPSDPVPRRARRREIPGVPSSPRRNSHPFSPLSDAPSNPHPSRLSRGRGRASLFGDANSVEMQMKQDPESLERENDAAIDHMGDRVAMLRKITSGIHDEAESHHRLLDGLSDNMGGIGGGLKETMSHFNKVFVENKNGRQFCYMVGGITFTIWFFYRVAASG